MRKEQLKEKNEEFEVGIYTDDVRDVYVLDFWAKVLPEFDALITWRDFVIPATLIDSRRCMEGTIVYCEALGCYVDRQMRDLYCVQMLLALREISQSYIEKKEIYLNLDYIQRFIDYGFDVEAVKAHIKSESEFPPLFRCLSLPQIGDIIKLPQGNLSDFSFLFHSTSSVVVNSVALVLEEIVSFFDAFSGCQSQIFDGFNFQWNRGIPS